jgi:hypothetical protein
MEQIAGTPIFKGYDAATNTPDLDVALEQFNKVGRM